MYFSVLSGLKLNPGQLDLLGRTQNSAFAVIVQLICLNLRHCRLPNHITRCFGGTNLFCSGKTTQEYVLVLLIGCKKSKNAHRVTWVNTVSFIVRLFTANYPPLMLWLLFYCEGLFVAVIHMRARTGLRTRVDAGGAGAPRRHNHDGGTQKWATLVCQWWFYVCVRTRVHDRGKSRSSWKGTDLCEIGAFRRIHIEEYSGGKVLVFRSGCIPKQKLNSELHRCQVCLWEEPPKWWR